MKKLGIVCGGGPAPGINSVIRAVVIEAKNRNLEVVGFLDGFYHLSRNKIVYRNLEIDDVSRIHYYGGSIIGTSRGNSSDEEVFYIYKFSKFGYKLSCINWRRWNSKHDI